MPYKTAATPRSRRCNYRCCPVFLASFTFLGAVTVYLWSPRCPTYPPPPEWAAAIARNDLLYTPDDGCRIPHKLMASLGNGYIGVQISFPVMYIAGLFNGPAVSYSHPTHRAEIEAPLNLKVDMTVKGAALDIRHATYLRRHQASSGPTIEQRWYAARAEAHGCLVMELSTIANGHQGSSVKLSGGLNDVKSGKRKLNTKDVAFTLTNDTLPIAGPLGKVDVLSGSTHTAEVKGDKPVKISVVSTIVPLSGDISLSNSTTAVFLSCVATSNEFSDPDKASRDAYVAAAKDATPTPPSSTSKLYSRHLAAWERLWQSGIEITGRPDASRAINASLYYTISSVRDDLPYSTSPGGLFSQAYNGHVFWDAETWMWPPLLLLHPSLAKIDAAVPKGPLTRRVSEGQILQAAV